LVLARGLSEQVELQGATGSDHGKGWSTHSRSTRDRMGFERFPIEGLAPRRWLGMLAALHAGDAVCSDASLRCVSCNALELALFNRWIVIIGGYDRGL
ncbi:hypothetical protein, partial [Acidovorax sp. SUPP2522]|uniref:hypothetical protein n=1 Tax=Acidovorax sp. SUPP2522 TaxID=511900 RepID=UPI0024E05533